MAIAVGDVVFLIYGPLAVDNDNTTFGLVTAVAAGIGTVHWLWGSKAGGITVTDCPVASLQRIAGGGYTGLYDAGDVVKLDPAYFEQYTQRKYLVLTCYDIEPNAGPPTFPSIICRDLENGSVIMMPDSAVVPVNASADIF